MAASLCESVGYWAADSGLIVSMHHLEEVGMIVATQNTTNNTLAGNESNTGMPAQEVWHLHTENMLMLINVFATNAFKQTTMRSELGNLSIFLWFCENFKI